MDNYINVLKDSIDTSIKLKIFKNREESAIKHIFNSILKKLQISLFKNIDNFDSNRLQKSILQAYPLTNRPRGNSDLNSVKYFQKQIQLNKEITPIWIVKKNNKYILLDGAHRIVASYIENKRYINAYVIEI